MIFIFSKRVIQFEELAHDLTGRNVFRRNAIRDPLRSAVSESIYTGPHLRAKRVVSPEIFTASLRRLCPLLGVFLRKHACAFFIFRLTF
jgi:hypothetical protein